MRVLLREASILVLDKPAGTAAWPFSEDADDGPARGQPVGLRDSDSSWRPIYPLEDEASGLAVLARGAAADILDAQRETGEFTVRFLALVRVAGPQSAGSIDLPLAVRDLTNPRVRIDPAHGSPARTEWSLLDAYAGFALLDCRPHPLLRHQVRAHLAAAGMPPAVDPLYGGGLELRLSSFKAGYRPGRHGPERPLIARVSIHAAELAFTHPDGRGLTFSAEPPRDFRAAVHQLGKYGRLGGV